MQILIVSKSLIIKELFKLIQKDVEFVSSAKDAEDINYSLIFVDDITPNLIDELNFIKEHLNGTIVLLGNNEKTKDLIDDNLQKPFLKEDLENLINRYTPKEPANILDPNEIEKIKELMNFDNKKSAIVEILEEREDLILKGKSAKRFLYEILDLEKKELKKLLKGAKISLKIKFKER